MGYSNFNGGSEIESGCIPNLPGGSIDASGEFYCSSNGYTVNVQFFGGTLPIFWATNIGEIVTTGQRTAQVHIDAAVDLTFVLVNIGSPTPILTPRNACGLAAYILRGRAKHVNANVTGAEFCIDTAPPAGFDECEGVIYNCIGERFSEILDLQAGYGGQCTQAGEDALINSQLLNYTDCAAGIPGGWPATCTEEEDVVPNVCPVPRCDTGSFAVVSYVGVLTGTCDGSTPAYGSANFGARNVIATLYNRMDVGSGSICDVRIDELKEGGCSPCALVHSLDCVVTAVDAGGNVVIVDIPINA